MQLHTCHLEVFTLPSKASTPTIVFMVEPAAEEREREREREKKKRRKNKDHDEEIKRKKMKNEK